MRSAIGTKKPLLLLLLLSPSIAEYLTGSTPVYLLVVNPALFALQSLYIIGLYGSGVLLIREAMARWNKGWATVLLLGAAYGIMEEGIAVHTFFEASGNPVGIMGSYGRLLGVNWVWATGLTIFHSIYSISLPILIIGLVYPEFKNRRWMDRSLTASVFAVYLFLIVFFFVIVSSKPGPLQLIFFLTLVVLLVMAARKVPAGLLSPRPGPTSGRPIVVVLASAMFFASWILVDVLAQTDAVPPSASIAILLLTSAVSLFVILRRVGNTLNDRAKLWIVTGLLSSLFAWDVLVELILVPGILVVSAVFVLFLVWLRKVVVERSQGEAFSSLSQGAGS